MPSKAEKRLARKALKLERDLEKSARQFIQPEPQRLVVEAAPLDLKKKIPEQKITPHQKLMCWDRSLEDKDGDWSWGAARKCAAHHWSDVVHPFFCEYEKKRWGEIDREMTGKRKKRRKKHVYYTFDKLIDEAYQRLVFLEIDDFAPSIFRFRLSGRRRVYGFRVDATATFHFVWFDPEHRLYQYSG